MNPNLRKRRAYGHDEVPATPVVHGWTQPPIDLDTLSLPVEHRYILDQGALSYVLTPSDTFDQRPQYALGRTAFFLSPPVNAQLAFSNPQYPYPNNQEQPNLVAQHHSHKRPRLNQSIPMPVSYSDDLPVPHGQEKTPLGIQPDGGTNAGRKSYGLLPGRSLSSGWTGARLADCFASISMCSPFESQQSCESLASPPSYDYQDHRPPALETTVVSAQPQTSLLPTPVSPDSTALFLCDDPAMMAQYLASYPPLQPERVMDVQPAIRREEMIYPGVSATVKFECDQPYLVDTSVQASSLPGAYGATGASSPYDGRGIAMSLSSHFNPVQGFDGRSTSEHAPAHDEPTSVDWFPAPKATPVKRGPFKDQDSREKTALTRKMGSCIRCRMQRIRCNLDPENERGPCLSCKKIASSAKVYRLNCLRLKITDVKLFKPGQVKGQEWTNRWKDSVMDDIGTWESSQVRTIEVTEGYTGRSVKLKVRQFRPQEGDKVKRSWVSKNGNRYEVEVPAFAIVNLDDAKAEFDQYIKIGQANCFQRLMGSRDELLWQTYELAMKAAGDLSKPLSERSLLVATLDLWMSVRLTTKSFEIVGDDTLGMPRDIIKDQDSALYRKVPLPPVMGAQIDSLLIHQIQPRLRRKALEELQKMTQEKKQKTWLTTYLVTFILLHNIALITKHDADYARKHGMPTRFAREANVKEYNAGANTLLAYFHYCNKAIYPFSSECKDQDLQTLAELNDEEFSFVHRTRRWVAKRKNEWETLWAHDEYENEFYYLSQLFEHNWQPRTMA
ncbi:hypothetical protein N657DRAFT_639918 [Parathielavia appendiculata]|uniref:Zn(2)-C6 fungal-type domain-containing protein n=1 Tax=Parathielavia appendiculata TaxID=2587402 RepID=A0AAN6Z855_9PEZI|nr:hypothetical protein N657DRAFT_639918 [Parathielavia appendiculata]